MEFLINLEKDPGQKAAPSIISDSAALFTGTGKFSISLIGEKEGLHLNRFNGKDHEFLVFGDLIFNKNLKSASDRSAFLEDSLTSRSIYKLRGFFYLISIDRVTFKVEVHSSLFNILPVYYFQDESAVVISTSIKHIVNCQGKSFSLSEKSAIEKLLFYYTFENRTLFNEINLVPSCSHAEIDSGKFVLVKDYSPFDFFVAAPESQKVSLGRLSDLFLSGFEDYLPEEKTAISLTGGFDGRTVLAAAIKYGYSPETFSYGLPGDSDILIPRNIAEKMNFHHNSFLLTREYARESFWNDGIEFLERTDFSGNISRAHYVHIARSLSKEFKYLLTGNFGSELFRSMKSPGVMASPVLFSLFRSENKKDFEKSVKASRSLKYVNRDLIKRDLPEVIDEVWDYRQRLPGGLSPNQRFYTYIFAEVFRKYFGPEIVSQAGFITNRSPFLDFQFIKELLKTRIAGAYYNLNERNPFSRFNGQVLYSNIIGKACPALLGPMLDKGYRPADFLSFTGKARIMTGYLKRISRTGTRKDPVYYNYYYDENPRKIKGSILVSAFLEKEILDKELENIGDLDKTILANVLSLELAFRGR